MVSDVAHIREEIALLYMSAQLGLTGLAHGTPKHSFITARMERIEEGRQELETVVGEKATAMVAETLSCISEKPTRNDIEKVIKYELGDTEETALLLDYVRDMWETVELLIEKFGSADAHKILNAPGFSFSSRHGPKDL